MPDTNATPQFSIVTPVYNVPLDVLQDTVDSVLAQTFQDWEWILVDDRSPDQAVAPALRAYAASDPRIRLHERETNGGIVAASNDGVELANAPFLALLDHDDLLTPDALAAMASAIAKNPDEIDYLYSDEDKMLPDGTLAHEFIKPDWSPERLRHSMYVCHFSVLRTSLVREIGGFRPGFDGSQDHDLVLRVTEKARLIHHVPKILYHWRVIPGSAAGQKDAKPYAWVAGRKAVQDHVDRVGIDATVEYGEITGLLHLHRVPDLTTPTSIIIPTRGSSGLIWGTHRSLVVEAIRSVRENTAHTALEFVVVYDTATPADVLTELRKLTADIKLVEFTAPFNFSAKCNVGALHASGDVLIFLNDDVEAYSPEIVGQLIAPLREAGVGITGPQLWFENTRVQHAGVAYGDGHISHMHYKKLGIGHRDPELHVNREVSALTGACVAVNRSVFEDIGGFSEALPMNFNDIDFSLKIRGLGLRAVWLWDAVLWHFESITRETHVSTWESDLMARRWGPYKTKRDRYRSVLH